jgi:hypothetical protein
MNTPINDGGPAFPTHENVNDPRTDGFHSVSGMTLRDWFAGQALMGQIARGADYEKPSHAAEDAYDLADAMLAARQVRQ